MRRAIFERSIRAAAAIVLAAAVNAALFWAIAAMNQSAPRSQRERPDQPVRYRPEPEPPQIERPDRVAPEPSRSSEPQPPKAAVAPEVAPPEPTPVRPEPVPVAMDVPTQRISPIELATSAKPSPALAASSTTNRSNQQGSKASSGSGDSAAPQQAGDAPDRPLRLVQRPRLQFGPNVSPAKQRARALMRITVDKTGAVTRIELVRLESGSRLAVRKFIAAKNELQFQPAIRDGEPIAVTRTVRMNVRSGSR